MERKTILFIHNNFPAQFKNLAPALAKNKKYDIHCIGFHDFSFKNITYHKYKINRGSTKDIHKYAIEFETKMIRADAVAQLCLKLKEKKINPDLIISHPGWGETFFLKEIWPNSKLINYFEFWYNTSNSDIDFDKDQKYHPKINDDFKLRIVARNTPNLKIYMESDTIICPTNFQKSTAPLAFRKNIKVIHDGIDTSVLKPTDKAFVELKRNDGSSVRVTKKDKIITFVNRNLEPYRGYDKFMKALPEILKKHPDAYVLIVGGDGVSYGMDLENNQTYKNIFYNEVKDDLPVTDRIYFLGRVDYSTLIAIFGVATAHVYFTYPFVLSWSVLEAMAMGALVIGSKTDPVEEVIKHNKNGILVDFFDTNDLINAVNKVLVEPDNYEKLRQAARQTIVENYDLKKICLPEQIKIVEGMLR